MDRCGRGGHLLFIHGTTLAVNTLLQRSGDPVGLIVTREFRDLLELRRLRLREAARLFHGKAGGPGAAASGTGGERAAPGTGERYRPLVPAEVETAADELVQPGCRPSPSASSTAYVRGSHEREAARLIHDRRHPDAYVDLAPAVAPAREYERGLVTVINALVVADARVLRAAALGTPGPRLLAGPILSMRSNGGVMTARSAGELPVHTLFSGPAAGVMGAAWAARRAGLAHVITLDMGGTSADVSIVDGDPSYSTEASVGEFPVIMPSVDICGRSERAAARSRGWTRAASSRWGRSRRGPIRGRSAMGEAAPADRHGRLRHARRAAPGPLPGRRAPARRRSGAGRSRRSRPRSPDGPLPGGVGGPRGGHREHVRAAHAPSRQARRGPGRVRLPYGGAGPTHVFLLAREVGIPRVVVPPLPGALCALGCLVADLRADFVSTLNVESTHAAPADVEAAFRALGTRAADWVAGEGLPVGAQTLVRSAEMRYKGQSFEINVTLPAGPITDLAPVLSAFHAATSRLRLRRSDGTGRTGGPAAPGPWGPCHGRPPRRRRKTTARSIHAPALRRVYLDGGFVDAGVYQRAALRPGDGSHRPRRRRAVRHDRAGAVGLPRPRRRLGKSDRGG